MCLSEIRVKQIRANQGLGVLLKCSVLWYYFHVLKMQASCNSLVQNYNLCSAASGCGHERDQFTLPRLSEVTEKTWNR